MILLDHIPNDFFLILTMIAILVDIFIYNGIQNECFQQKIIVRKKKMIRNKKKSVFVDCFCVEKKDFSSFC